nr:MULTISPECIES: cold-inducible protein YdjO-related protein [unclassified Paenibacillus]
MRELNLEKQEAPKAELKPTVIWKCKDSSCKAWVREEFSPAPYPACPLCSGPTIRSYKHLAAVSLAKKPRKTKKTT